MKIITIINNQVGRRRIFKRVPVSRDNLRSGNIVIFNYSGKGERLGLVVEAIPPKYRTKTNIWFCKNTSNTLVNVVRLNDNVSEVIEMISSSLKKRGAISESQMGGLSALVGKGSFRTYNYSLIRNMYKLDYIMKEEIRLEGEGYGKER